ncbi:hypothetical protein [Candidatus Amarobacter glycogenicus]|uniref:hypothetical protein n=1 Tax=Candidatus Amarobacter glycogenicus TaxID=3140699 RepID=UPI0031CC3F5F
MHRLDSGEGRARQEDEDAHVCSTPGFAERGPNRCEVGLPLSQAPLMRRLPDGERNRGRGEACRGPGLAAAAFNVSNRSAISAPDMRALATDQSKNEASKTANDWVNAKISTATPSTAAPSAIDFERP